MHRLLIALGFTLTAAPQAAHADGNQATSSSLVLCRFDQIGVGSICPNDWSCIDSQLPGNLSVCVPPDQAPLAPVCGADGRSYHSRGVADAVGVPVAAMGACRPQGREPPLPASVDPACAQGRPGAFITLEAPEPDGTSGQFTVFVTDPAFVEAAYFYRERITEEPSLFGRLGLGPIFLQVNSVPGCDRRYAWNVDATAGVWEGRVLECITHGPNWVSSNLHGFQDNPWWSYCPSRVRVTSIISAPPPR
jgi:hypothetical protein